MYEILEVINLMSALYRYFALQCLLVKFLQSFIPRCYFSNSTHLIERNLYCSNLFHIILNFKTKVISFQRAREIFDLNFVNGPGRKYINLISGCYR